MIRQFVYWTVLGTLLGAVLGMMVGKSDLGAPVVVAAIGALLGLVGAAVVRGMERILRLKTGRTDYPALGGALAGAVVGGIVGPQSGLGRLMIAVFNPDLPERDFATAFGMIGGILGGSFLGAALLSGIYRLGRWKERSRGESQDDSSGV